jgi:hypothetical protein
MTNDDKRAGELRELADLLDTWGGNAERWPAAAREHITRLAASGPEAARLLAEARALDRLLDRAADHPTPFSPASAAALTDRILAAAMSSTAPGAAPAHLSSTRSNVVPFRAPVRPALAPRRSFATGWPAAGLIAASLATGLYLGGSVNLAPLLQEIAEVAGLSSVVDPSLASIGDDLGEEETL